jgi:hypothetical protein
LDSSEHDQRPCLHEDEPLHQRGVGHPSTRAHHIRSPIDPKVLDHIPPIERYKNQPQSLTLIEEPPFDQHGEYKESTPSVAKKNEKVLDAETPTDDPNYDAAKKMLSKTRD